MGRLVGEASHDTCTHLGSDCLSNGVPPPVPTLLASCLLRKEPTYSCLKVFGPAVLPPDLCLTGFWDSKQIGQSALPLISLRQGEGHER